MKKSLLTLLLTCSIYVFAQDSKIKFDVHGGVTVSKISGYEQTSFKIPNYNERPGFAFLAGVGFEKELNSKLSLRCELNYERKRQNSDNIVTFVNSLEGKPIDDEFVIRQDLNYLTLPLTVKYFVSNNKKYYINGGLFLGYLINATKKTTFINDIEKSIF